MAWGRAPILWLSYGSTMSAEQLVGGNSGDRSPRPAVNGMRCIVTLSGIPVSFAGEEPRSEFSVAAGAMARDAERTARHLDFGRWEAMVVESVGGVLGFAPSGPDGDQLAVVGFPPGTPSGAVQRAAARMAARGIVK